MKKNIRKSAELIVTRCAALYTTLWRLYGQHRKKVNYLLVGGWNCVFGYLVFAGLYYLLESSWNYILILILVNIITISMAYVGYKFFVFKTRGNYLREYLRFYLVYGFGALLGMALFPLFVYYMRINAYIAQLLINGIVILISVIAHTRFSFRTHARPGVPAQARKNCEKE